jgi:hypothetical protein
MDNLMREQNPAFLRDDLDQILLYFHRVNVFGETEAARHPLYMSVNHYSRGDAVCGAEDNVRGLPRGSGNGQQIV